MRVTLTGALGGSFAVRLAGAGAAFTMHVMLARLAGAEQYGTYSYVVSCIGVLVLISTVGLDVSLVKYTAAYHAQAQWALLKGIVRWAHGVVLTIACTIALLAGLVAGLGRDGPNTVLVHTVWIGCGILPVTAGLRLIEARLMGFRRVVLAEIPDGVLRPVAMAGTVALLFWLPGRPLHSADAMGLHLLVLIAVVVMSAALLRKVVRPSATAATPSYEMGAWLRVSLPLWLDSGMRLLSASLDILLVGAMLGMAEAGVYTIVNRLAELIVFGTNASQAAVRPYIAALHAEGNEKAMQRVVMTASSWGTLFAVVTCGCLIPARALLLRQFGEEYLSGASALIALALGNLVAACTAIAHAVMNMTDHQRANMRITAVCLALRVPLSVVAVSRWGFTGAAAVSGGMLAVSCLWSWSYVRRALGVDGTVLGWFRQT